MTQKHTHSSFMLFSGHDLCDNKLQKGVEWPGQFPSGTLVWHLDKNE
jgi:hypothetical protein